MGLVLSYVGFVSLGLPDTILGASWPAIRSDLRLPLPAAGSAVMVTMVGIVSSSAASGWVRARFGTATVLIASTLLAAIALLVGAMAPSWSVFLVGALIAGLGGGAIDASLNHLVARRHSARHMNWLHACWGVGASLTPMLVAWLLKRGLSWRWPYAILACVELVLSAAFLANRRGWADDDQPPPSATAAERLGGPRGAMAASVALFALYGGVEASAGLWATSLLTMTRGASPATAGAMVAVYWGALTIGRFVLGASVHRLGPLRLLRFAARGAVVALGLLALPGTPLWFWGAALAALGFALAPIYPVTMHDTASRFEEAGARLVGYQVAACSVGVAVLPGLIGVIGAWTSPLLIPPAMMLLAGGVLLLEVRRRRRV
ncbi:MAG TPA: MFS transporter [Polyangia bacterium]